MHKAGPGPPQTSGLQVLAGIQPDSLQGSPKGEGAFPPLHPSRYQLGLWPGAHSAPPNPCWSPWLWPCPPPQPPCLAEGSGPPCSRCLGCPESTRSSLLPVEFTTRLSLAVKDLCNTSTHPSNQTPTALHLTLPGGVTRAPDGPQRGPAVSASQLCWAAPWPGAPSSPLSCREQILPVSQA